MRLLIVCTANRCRSALAEVIADRGLAERGLAGTVASAGTAASEGAPATDGAIITARKLGLDLSAHRSQPVTRELIARSDMVLTMEPGHTIEVVGAHGASLASTFTVLELADLITATPGRSDQETVSDWLQRATVGRTPDASMRARQVDDPIGRSMRHYRSTAQIIGDGLRVILDHAAAPRQ